MSNYRTSVGRVWRHRNKYALDFDALTMYVTACTDVLYQNTFRAVWRKRFTTERIETIVSMCRCVWGASLLTD